jgi:membrane protease YdiL (CAAX protease family)
MHLVDHVLILLLFVIQPVWGAIEARRIEARAKAGQPPDRIRFYSQTALLECTFLAVLFTTWFALDRTVADLGFISPGGAGFWTGTVLLIALTGVLFYQWRSAAKATDEEKAQLAQSFGKLEHYLPHNTRELNSFYGVSIVAGIVEEIVYRGFVLWYLAQFMPLWFAVAVSSVAFGLGHSYQGPSGALRTGLIGLAFGIYYVTTGSIWLPIIAHILLDALQGGTIHEILRRDDDCLDPKPSPE